MLRAIIFDFDGVITDSEVIHLAAFNRLLSKYGIEISENEYYKDYLGLTDADVIRTLAEKKLFGDNPDIDSLVRQKNRIFDDMVKNDSRILPDVEKFLQMLRQNKIPMAICSGALMAEIKLILEKAGLRSFFEAIVSAEQVKKGKPHPEGFLLALKKLNEKYRSILPNQCIVIEDSHWGLEAAAAAGMHTIAVTNSYSAEQLKMSEKIVNRLGELSMDDLQKLCA